VLNEIRQSDQFREGRVVSSKIEIGHANGGPTTVKYEIASGSPYIKGTVLEIEASLSVEEGYYEITFFFQGKPSIMLAAKPNEPAKGRGKVDVTSDGLYLEQRVFSKSAKKVNCAFTISLLEAQKGAVLAGELQRKSMHQEAIREAGNARSIDPNIGKGSETRAESYRMIGKDDEAGFDASIQKLKDKNPEVRREAAFDLGALRDARAVEPLITALKDGDSKVRMRAANALGKIKSSTAFSVMIGAMLEANLEIIAGAYPFYIQKGLEQAEPLLIKALDKYGDKEMATAFLNCNNARLEKAGRKWVEEHGYQVLRMPGSSGGLRWGDK
jgi:hypothetical protein